MPCTHIEVTLDVCRLTCTQKSVQHSDHPILAWACAYSAIQDSVTLQQLQVHETDEKMEIQNYTDWLSIYMYSIWGPPPLNFGTTDIHPLLSEILK